MTALLAGARWPQAASTSASAAAPSARPSSRTVLILGCISLSIAPPMPVLAGTPCRSPYLARPITGLAAAPAGASPSNAAQQSDRQLDGCALPEKVEKNLHPPAPGAGPLHDRDQPRERAARAAARRSLPCAPCCAPRTTGGPQREARDEARRRAYGARRGCNFNTTSVLYLRQRSPIFQRFYTARRHFESAFLSHPCSPRAGALPGPPTPSRGTCSAEHALHGGRIVQNRPETNRPETLSRGGGTASGQRPLQKAAARPPH